LFEGLHRLGVGIAFVAISAAAQAPTGLRTAPLPGPAPR